MDAVVRKTYVSPIAFVNDCYTETLTLNQSVCNIRSAHCLTMVNICGELFQNSSKGSKVIEWTQNSHMTFDQNKIAILSTATILIVHLESNLC